MSITRLFTKSFTKRLFTSSPASNIIIATLIDGDSRNYPVVGDYVEVHYEGFLTNGTLFDSTRKRGETFCLRLGENRIIKGLELGLRNISLGETAKITIPSESGYGNQEIENVIPKNSTLVFNIELVNIYRPLKSVKLNKPRKHVHGEHCNNYFCNILMSNIKH